MKINKYIKNPFGIANDVIENYDKIKNLSIQSNQKFEELSVLYEDNSEYNRNYNKLINIYNNYMKKEIILKEILYKYKNRLLNGEELTTDEKFDIKEKKDLRKQLLIKIDEIKIKLNSNTLCQKDQNYIF